MRCRLTRVALACAAVMSVSALLTLPTALAAGGNAIINDCQANGRLTQSYTKAELRHALAIMPASVKQYTSCADVINRALTNPNSLKGSGTGGGSGGSFLPTPVIIILVVLVLAAVTFGALAIRRRRADQPSEGPGEPGEMPPDGSP
jgi:hypothetical protein